MIQAKELRLGNLVYTINRSGEVHLPTETPFKIHELQTFQVMALTADIIPATREYEIFRYSDLSPIPLTPEILEKCGFKTRTPDSYYVLSWISPRNIILNRYKDDRGYFFLYPALWSPTMHIKYLHQLQNLTHALTGEELNVEWSVATEETSG